MAGEISSAALVGCTGLVGSQILTTLTSLSTNPTIHAIARRDLPTFSAKVQTLVESDTSKWPSSLQSLSPTPTIFLSALGTTYAQAGSIEAQRKVDYGLNLSLAKAAKESGTKVYVLISSAGVSTHSMSPYLKMKAELEEAVKELGFPHTVLVKPGLLLGNRKERRLTESVLRTIARGMGAISKAGLVDWWAQDVDVIGKAAVTAGLQCLEGERHEGIWEVGQSEILRLGRKEWKGDQ